MRKSWLVFSQAVTVSLGVFFVISTLKPDWIGMRPPAEAPQVVSITSSSLKNLPPVLPGGAVTSYSAAAQRASPAVVSITASKAPPRSNQFEDPLSRFFFGERWRQHPGSEAQVGLGSGVIVSGDGYLLTNNHVINGADDIEVMLVDGRQARARLVGTDPETDVAVLKIELQHLPAISFGNADRVQVGDVVLAIGNPFDVGQTVTSGIVSALGRNKLGINTFENFIQTDAAINPGNSGGALVDAEGNLVGINTAIYSRTGGSLGIGFAIPASTARQVMEALIQDGKVTRGFIGVEQRDITPDIARTLNIPVTQGVLITGVLKGGPANLGGVHPGDVIVSLAGRPVQTASQLLNAVASLKPQQVVPVRLQRGNQVLNLELKVAQRPPSASPSIGPSEAPIR